MHQFPAYALVMLLSVYVAFRAMSGYNVSFIGAAALLMIPLMLALLVIAAAENARPGTKKFSNLRLLCVSVFAALLLAEGLLRILKVNITYPEILGQSRYFSPYWNDKNYWYVYDPQYPINTPRKDFVHQRKVNSLGLTERELALTGKDDVKKVLCLGDSFTEGIGAPEDSTWPRLLEKYLNASGTDSFLVYNAGVSGSDPVYQYHLLRGKLWDADWHTVIFCMNGTDIDDCKIRGGLERFTSDSTVEYRKTIWWEPLYASSYLFRLLINNFLGYDQFLLTKEENSRYERQAVSSISTALLRAKMETQARGIRMVLVVHPLKGEADSKHFSNRFMDTLLVAVGELAPVNLLPYFADSISGDNKSEKYYWKNDAHFNPEGYHIMAERIKKEVFP